MVGPRHASSISAPAPTPLLHWYGVSRTAPAGCRFVHVVHSHRCEWAILGVSQVVVLELDGGSRSFARMSATSATGVLVAKRAAFTVMAPCHVKVRRAKD